MSTTNAVSICDFCEYGRANIKLAPCGHVFHSRCIFPWPLSSCPACSGLSNIPITGIECLPIQLYTNTNRSETVQHEDNHKQYKKIFGMQRTGRWINEEIDYAKALTDAFVSGTLPLTHDTKLGAFLGQMLQCGPTRITSKFRIGKRVFHSRRLIALNAAEIIHCMKSQRIISKLEESMLQKISIINPEDANIIAYHSQRNWTKHFQTLWCLRYNLVYPSDEAPPTPQATSHATARSSGAPVETTSPLLHLADPPYNHSLCKEFLSVNGLRSAIEMASTSTASMDDLVLLWEHILRKQFNNPGDLTSSGPECPWSVPFAIITDLQSKKPLHFSAALIDLLRKLPDLENFTGTSFTELNQLIGNGDAFIETLTRFAEHVEGSVDFGQSWTSHKLYETQHYQCYARSIPLWIIFLEDFCLCESIVFCTSTLSLALINFKSMSISESVNITLGKKNVESLLEPMTRKKKSINFDAVHEVASADLLTKEVYRSAKSNEVLPPPHATNLAQDPNPKVPSISSGFPLQTISDSSATNSRSHNISIPMATVNYRTSASSSSSAGSSNSSSYYQPFGLTFVPPIPSRSEGDLFIASPNERVTVPELRTTDNSSSGAASNLPYYRTTADEGSAPPLQSTFQQGLWNPRATDVEDPHKLLLISATSSIVKTPKRKMASAVILDQLEQDRVPDSSLSNTVGSTSSSSGADDDSDIWTWDSLVVLAPSKRTATERNPPMTSQTAQDLTLPAQRATSSQQPTTAVPLFIKLKVRSVETAVQSILALTPFDLLEFWIPVHLQGSTQIVFGGSFTTRNDLNGWASFSRNFTFQPRVGLPGRVVSSQRPEVNRDVSSLPGSQYLRVDGAKLLGIHASVALPLVHTDGVVVVYSKDVFEPKPQLIDYLQSLFESISFNVTKPGNPKL